MSKAYPDGNEPQCYSGDAPYRNSPEPVRKPQIGNYHSIMGEPVRSQDSARTNFAQARQDLRNALCNHPLGDKLFDALDAYIDAKIGEQCGPR